MDCAQTQSIIPLSAGAEFSPRRFILLLTLWLAVAGALTSARLISPGFGPQGDLFHHYYLTEAFARGLSEGEWLPRWAGILDGGRGDAVFTFYSPLFYWLSGGLTAFAGMNPLTALKVLLFLSFVMAQASAWLLAREFYGIGPSIIAGISYVTLPAWAHIALQRGFLSNTLALSLMPLALLGAFRLMSGSRNDEGKQPAGALLLFALSYGAIILIHPITAYLCALAVALLVLCCLKQGGWRGLMKIGGGVLLALALTAFFWLPQVLEMKWVQADLEVTRHPYHNYFLFAEAPDASLARQVWAGINQIASVLTLLQTALVIVLCIAAYRGLRRARQGFLWWCLSFTLIALLVSLPVSDILWRGVPGMKFVQFPWRLQPFVSLATGLLMAAAVAGWKQNGKHVRALLAAVITWLLLISLVFTFLIARPQGQSLQRSEVQQLLHPVNAPTLTAQQVGELRDRGDLSYLAYAANRVPFRPRGADLRLYPPTDQIGGLSIVSGRGSVTAQEIMNSHRRFTLMNDEPVRVRVETYFYPDWIARIDSQPVRVATEPGSGLMLIEVPAGAHVLTLDFEISQLAGRGGQLVSVAALLVLMVLTLRWMTWLFPQKTKD
ncbi:MAG: hypothetical protein U0Z53_27575 [Blastocatellia bacterium]